MISKNPKWGDKYFWVAYQEKIIDVAEILKTAHAGEVG